MNGRGVELEHAAAGGNRTCEIAGQVSEARGDVNYASASLNRRVGQTLPLLTLSTVPRPCYAKQLGPRSLLIRT